jgi:hypothetical protein
MTRRLIATAVLAGLSWCFAATGPALAARGAQASPQVGATGTPELLLDQGKKLFDAFQYDQAVPLFDRVIAQLAQPAGAGPIQKADLLVEAYELRARARFAQGDSLGTEQDFSALLTIQPSFKLGPGISPRVVSVFEQVRKVTVGQIAVSLTPPGNVDIDGRSFALQADPQIIDLPAGDHTVTAARTGYTSLNQKFTIVASQVSPLALTMDRSSSTLTVVSIPDGVEVLFDGTSRGKTVRNTGSEDGTASLLLTDLQAGSHKLQLLRACYTSVEQTVTIDQPGDLRTDPLRLASTVATAKVTASEPGASIFIDGVARGQAPAEFTDVCAGPHLIEVRGSTGRFIDRREWKSGDNTTITAALRSAFPIVSAKAGTGLTADQLRMNAERALAAATQVLVYSPSPADLDAALRGETLPADWLNVDPAAPPDAAPRVPREVTRDLGKRIAGKLGAQGVAVISPGPDAYTFAVALLAAGSGEPDVTSIPTADAAARNAAMSRLDAPLPPLVRPSIETSVVDLVGTSGAVVVRPDGVGAKAGLVVGDVIVAAAGAPVTSVADLRARLDGLKAPVAEVTIDVKKATGEARKVTVPLAFAADALPMRDPSLLYNHLLISLEDAAKVARTPAERAADAVNLAIVDMRLGNWDEAQAALNDAHLPEGRGVSAGTVAYLSGLCLDALGRSAEAQAAFTKAAAAPQARLSLEGPLVAPLARQRLVRPAR